MTLIASAFVPGVARSSATAPSGFELGFRSGVGLPLGDYASGVALSDLVAFQIPVALDAPESPLDPWVGVGIGYEHRKARVSFAASEVSGSNSGFELKAEIGTDLSLAQSFSIGPYAALALGEYVSFGEPRLPGGVPSSKALHAWAFLGTRARFDAF